MQNLIQMLKEYNIKHIISVDDGWKTTNDIEEIIKNQGLDDNITIKKYCDQYAIDINDDERTCFNEIKDELLVRLNSFKRNIPQTYLYICEALNVDVDSSLETLKNILDQLNGFNICYSEKFENGFQDLNGNSLFILDKNMGKNQENEFLEYIIHITSERKEYNDLIIIYSNEVSDLLSHDKKVKYINANDTEGKALTILYQFWPLEKITDEIKLIEGIKEMISKSMYGKALSKMIEMRRVSIKKAFDDLIQIDVDNLDDMIIESYIEGGKITESYDMIIDALIKKSILEHIETSDILCYEKGLIQYESKRAKEILAKEGIVDAPKKYRKFRKESLKKKVINSVEKNQLLFNIADYGINREFNNPAMGDIYVFTEAKSNKQYAGMLISQECSIMIRKDSFTDKPRRTSEEFLLLIFDIVDITDENINDSIISKLEEHIWPIKIGKNICLLKNTKKSKYINAEILDLCGLNADGKAKINFEEKSLEYKSEFSREYYIDFSKIIEEKIDRMKEEIIKRSGIKETQNIKNMIISLGYGIIYRDDFALQRICKIDEKHTLHIVHEYLNGIAKIGLPIAPNL